LDRDSGAVLEQLPLPGVPDVIMLDPELDRLYVAIGDPGVVCAFTGRPLEHLETTETEPGAHTYGWDPDAHSLYVFCPKSGGVMSFEDRGCAATPAGSSPLKARGRSPTGSARC